MYHPANIKKWFHHIHLLPHRTNITRAENLLRNKKLWAAIGITAFVLGFILLMIWVEQAAISSSSFNLNPHDLYWRYPHYP